MSDMYVVTPFWFLLSDVHWSCLELRGTSPFIEDALQFQARTTVRNGLGFAGVKTGEGFNYITARRGLPDWLEIEDDCVYVDDEQESPDHKRMISLYRILAPLYVP